MIQKILSLYKPEIYHGHKKKNSFFEGWYFKLVNKEGNEVYAVIPGIFKSRDKKEEHAFIQVNDGIHGVSEYMKFHISEFKPHKSNFDLNIGNNRFTSDGMSLKLKGRNFNIDGSLEFFDKKSWPRTLLAPSIMGWYSYVPFMECNHALVSMDHSIKGNLEINGSSSDFTGGRGYIEKDWGSSFPSSYVWLQSNHYSRAGVSLMASVANIPWIGSSFRGFIIAFLTPEAHYLFATYNKSELLRLKVDKKNIQIAVRNKNYILNIDADREEGAQLFAPYDGSMAPRIIESLNGTIRTVLTERSGKIIYEGYGFNSGMESHGKLEEITTG